MNRARRRAGVLHAAPALPRVGEAFLLPLFAALGLTFLPLGFAFLFLFLPLGLAFLFLFLPFGLALSLAHAVLLTVAFARSCPGSTHRRGGTILAAQIIEVYTEIGSYPSSGEDFREFCFQGASVHKVQLPTTGSRV
jgi:hypothetical protein